MVANGDIDPSSTPTLVLNDNSAGSTKLLSQLDGKVATNGDSEAAGTPFNVAIKSDGSITVSVTGTGATKASHELYPDNNGQGRIDYAGDLS
jgi:hypothetical protein